METAISTRVNPDVLKWARERLGLKPKDVQKESKSLGSPYDEIDKNKLLQWERGESEPALENLEALSEIYICPVGYFFQSEPPMEKLPLSFRGLSAEKAGSLAPLSQQTLRRFMELAEWTVYMMSQLGVAWEIGLKQVPPPRTVRELVEIIEAERKRFEFTQQVRETWRSADDAFLWWRKRIESRGVFCFQMKLAPRDIRGASAWLDTRYPFILVNHEDIEKATGRTFTLLHEYAHLILHGQGVVCDFRGHKHGRKPERFANQFAARMLLSTDELKARLKELGMDKARARWSDEILDQVRSPFFVSRNVIVIMLQEMGLAPDGYYQVKREQWERIRLFGKGGLGTHPTKNELALRKLGYSLAGLLARSASRDTVSYSDLTYFLDMKVEKAKSFLEWAEREVSANR